MFQVVNIIQVGDVVEIKSGSVGMTVISLNGEVANCLWVVDGIPNQIEVLVSCLKVKESTQVSYSAQKEEWVGKNFGLFPSKPNQETNSYIGKGFCTTTFGDSHPLGLFEFAMLNKSTQAFHLLCEKVEKLNGKDHKFNWSDNSRKWYVYWNMETNSFGSSNYSRSGSFVSARLCLKSEELCKQFVEENTELLKDYFAVNQ